MSLLTRRDRRGFTWLDGSPPPVRRRNRDRAADGLSRLLLRAGCFRRSRRSPRRAAPIPQDQR